MIWTVLPIDYFPATYSKQNFIIKYFMAFWCIVKRFTFSFNQKPVGAVWEKQFWQLPDKFCLQTFDIQKTIAFVNMDIFLSIYMHIFLKELIQFFEKSFRNTCECWLGVIYTELINISIMIVIYLSYSYIYINCDGTVSASCINRFAVFKNVNSPTQLIIIFWYYLGLSW